MKSKIFRLLAIVIVATMCVGCEKAMEPCAPGPGGNLILDGFKVTPKKTITIKRKKPTILNPSPRPLSADYPTDTASDEEYTIEEIEFIEE